MKRNLPVSFFSSAPWLKNGMINTRSYKIDELQFAYNRRSWLYSKIVAPIEFNNQLLALAKARIKQNEKVLEVAVGSGKAFLEIMKPVGPDSYVYGVDISENMLRITEKLIRTNGFLNYKLRQANSRTLPFNNNSFDVLYSAYMLDLIPLEEMDLVLKEFKRVLKPGGRLVLLNMSKPDKRISFREILYKVLPSTFVLYIMGGCRPVLLEKNVAESGFQKISRDYIIGRSPSEIIVSTKPKTSVKSNNYTVINDE